MPIFTITAVLLLASMFGTVNAVEVHKNGFGGITPFNTTGLTVFNESLKRSFDYESDSLVLSAEFSILETNGDIRDFSLFDNDLTLQNDAPSPEAEFVDSTFRTSLETINGGASGGQWATAPHSESLAMENMNVSLVWWGQIKDSITMQFITGKACLTTSYSYGLSVDIDGEISAVVGTSGCGADTIETNLPSGGLDFNRTYGIGVVFEDAPGGAEIYFWLDGEWIYRETSSNRVWDNGGIYYVGRSQASFTEFFCNCTHDEVLVFKERLSNDTMKLLTTKQHDIVIRSGPGVTPQGFAGLFFALPWLIVFGLLGWLFYIIAMAWREPFTGE